MNQIDRLISIDRVVVDRRLSQKSHGSSRARGYSTIDVFDLDRKRIQART
ncbi:MAG: hypothetical protein JGK04_16680 [Microcoleus sp. PH2017_39_LGB_O_B]|nr:MULTISPECIES: hypothetical protein [unclassified Microcoleus]MCC3508236.1 hypothetical protein [Microcoleus sp. PH2017_17_BER_D_A]MCC3642037.1 hypothetical protein [Microcoleus sp. PH2017_33_LGB_O_A]MCC3449041.1 hypothetical protein [Microcoleus sp. PH2017_09_SFU_O_A]MCC3585706.1 hypothetical protein [Microcoleus sp. PH2017_30_WIL_O_A]MCC3630029.1 hypothetical protein [Microcoleus sp. PH2017_39_LGB_O_B]